MDSFFTVLSSVATAVAAGAAIASWRAAASANESTGVLAKVELDRRHSELRPMFMVGFSQVANTNIFKLVVKLDGPGGLDRLDSLTITIRDNKLFPASPTGYPTQEDIAKQIWSPYRFSPSVDGASSDGRSVPHEELLLGDLVVYQLEKSLAPAWTNQVAGQEWWEPLGIESVLRISLACEHKEFGSWLVPWEPPLG